MTDRLGTKRARTGKRPPSDDEAEDLETDGDKQELRRQKNREAARRVRERRTTLVNQLKQERDQLRKENQQLIHLLKEKVDEVTLLRAQAAPILKTALSGCAPAATATAVYASGADGALGASTIAPVSPLPGSPHPPLAADADSAVAAPPGTAALATVAGGTAAAGSAGVAVGAGGDDCVVVSHSQDKETSLPVVTTQGPMGVKLTLNDLRKDELLVPLRAHDSASSEPGGHVDQRRPQDRLTKRTRAAAGPPAASPLATAGGSEVNSHCSDGDGSGCESGKRLCSAEGGRLAALASAPLPQGGDAAAAGRGGSSAVLLGPSRLGRVAARGATTSQPEARDGSQVAAQQLHTQQQVAAIDAFDAEVQATLEALGERGTLASRAAGLGPYMQHQAAAPPALTPSSGNMLQMTGSMGAASAPLSPPASYQLLAASQLPASMPMGMAQASVLQQSVSQPLPHAMLSGGGSGTYAASLPTSASTGPVVCEPPPAMSGGMLPSPTGGMLGSGQAQGGMFTHQMDPVAAATAAAVARVSAQAVQRTTAQVHAANAALMGVPASQAMHQQAMQQQMMQQQAMQQQMHMQRQQQMQQQMQQMQQLAYQERHHYLQQQQQQYMAMGGANTACGYAARYALCPTLSAPVSGAAMDCHKAVAARQCTPPPLGSTPLAAPWQAGRGPGPLFDGEDGTITLAVRWDD